MMQPATRTHHPAQFRPAPAVPPAGPMPSRVEIPAGANDALLQISGREVKLTNLAKPFWPTLGITKRHLLQYYADVAWALLPHVRSRAMVMKRYPDGAGGDFFFMKHAPANTPDWMPICSIMHASANQVDFPVVDELAGLLWVVNLGCIDLNPWYARCDDVDRPDYLHFDLDPVPPANLEQVRETALQVRDALVGLGMKPLVKTTGSRGLHIYVGIQRGPTQKQVWTFAKRFAQAMEQAAPALVTAEYRIANRPEGRVLVDYNQNAWGRTLASVYSVRPKQQATVSMPVTWSEVEKGVKMEEFTLQNAPARLRKRGDLWASLNSEEARFPLGELKWK